MSDMDKYLRIITTPIDLPELRLTTPLKRALIASQVVALVWWLAALAVRSAAIAPVWYDQSITFTRNYNLAEPYQVSSFIYPPWTAIVFTIFSVPPFITATLIQLCLYCALLTGVIFKFGGNLRAVLITLTSFVMFDSALELNIEWLVCLGLLVPPVFSGPLLVIKPQLALGYWFGLDRQSFVRAVIGLLLVLLVSFALWGAWPLQMLEGIQVNTLGRAYHLFNLAPLVLMPAPLSLGIGLVLIVLTVRRHDPALGILAWMFFVPYITLYSLTLPFAIVAVRWPRVALLISVVMWLVYGSVLARFLMHL
jgi:hypothetical protein